MIPCLDVEATLGRQLDALAAERAPQRWEVVVVDNGSRDGTASLAESYAGRLGGLRVVRERKRGRHHACNTGWRAAVGTKIAFVDADDVIEPGYVEAMATALDSYDLVAGRLRHVRPEARGDEWGAVQTGGLMPDLGFLPYVMGANFGVRRAALEAVGGFADDVPFGEDADVSWRLQLAGCTVGFAPEAVVRYEQRPNLRAMFRQHRRYGCAHALLYAKYRDRGMTRRSLRAAALDWVRVGVALPSLRERDVRFRMVRRLARNIGRIEGSLRARVLYL